MSETAPPDDHCCDELRALLRRGGLALHYDERFRSYGILYLSDAPLEQKIRFCPWCGARLPRELRGAWFDLLDEMGLAPDDPNLPAEMLSDAWWRRRGHASESGDDPPQEAARGGAIPGKRLIFLR